VTAVTFTDPTNLILALNVASNATPGLRTVSVTNPDGRSSTSLTGLLTVIHANVPPSLASIPDWTVTAGTALTFTNQATDPDVPPQSLTFSLGNGAGLGATVTPDTGIFSWTPGAAQLGTNAFSVIVTDNGSPPLSATQAFNVVVVVTNNPPALAPIASQTIHAMMTLTFTNSATDPDPGDALTFSLDPGAPAGATVGANSGIFQWAPNDFQIGTNPITVRVTDSWLPRQSAAQSLTVIVLPRPSASVALSGNSLTLTWSAIANRTYRVQLTTDLMSGPWSNLVPDIVATGPSATYPGILPANSAAFYRVVVVQ
jgi:hypothetical protein